MAKRHKFTKIIRGILGVLLLLMGLSMTWAWGEVGRLAEPAPTVIEEPPKVLYAAWRPEGAGQASLFRSVDEATTWQPLALSAEGEPVAWADDGSQQVAVLLDDGSLLLSKDQGETWIVVESGLAISSLIWGDNHRLYLGTEGQGVYQLVTDGALAASRMMRSGVASARIVSLSLIGGRLFAATPAAIWYTDDADRRAGSAGWVRLAPLPDTVTSIVAIDKETVYAGTATTGIFKSRDAGRTWEPSSNGLGPAAEQMVRVTALRSDPQEPRLLYAAVEYLVDSTHVQASAAGLLVTLDGGSSWQPSAGPAFPEAQHALNLLLISDKPLHALVVTAVGLQGYGPDVMRILAGLESDDPQMRASAARQLGITRPLGVWSGLIAALDDPEPAVSLAAADALGRINDPAAVPGLMIAVEHPSEQVRLGAARALGMMQVEAAVEPLRAMLLLGKGPEVNAGGEALGRIGGPAAIEALLAALEDPQPTARWHVAMAALEKMGEPAVASLVTMMDSEDAHVRHNAAQALGWIGSLSATEALMNALKRDNDATVRSEAAWALGEIGAPAAARALERAQRRDPAVEVRTAAEWALSRVPAQSEAVAGWATRWAPTLNQHEPIRWLILVLTLAGAAWLMMGNRSPVVSTLGLQAPER